MPLRAGFYTAILTPYSDGGDTINQDSIAALVNHNISQGIDGLYVGGSTSETFLQSVDERAQVLRAVAREASGKCTLIAHVGDINPRVAHNLAKVAANAGYDAISAIPPFYFGFEWEELKDFYRKLAGLTGLPFIVYYLPAHSGVKISTGHISELLNLPNVEGLKNTSSDYFALEQLVRTNPGKLIFNGYDETVLAGLAMGAKGGIGSTYNAQGYKFCALREAYETGDIQTARALQGEINELVEVLIEHGVLRSLKYLVELEGIPMGDCREPFHPLTDTAKSALAKVRERLLSRL